MEEQNYYNNYSIIHSDHSPILYCTTVLTVLYRCTYVLMHFHGVTTRLCSYFDMVLQWVHRYTGTKAFWLAVKLMGRWRQAHRGPSIELGREYCTVYSVHAEKTKTEIKTGEFFSDMSRTFYLETRLLQVL